MRSDNMPRPFAPEHGEEAASQLQRDIAMIDRLLDCRDNLGGYLYAPQRFVWQRLKPRLTPDRERVARALYEHAIANQGAVTWGGWLAKADAAIDAMGETP